MNENDRKGPASQGEDGHAAHGYRNEVSWDGGAGRQPYTNQGSEEQGPDAAAEVEAGDAGEVAGRNAEQLAEVKRKEERPEREAPRET
jgi:hypothetical protein